jgi:HSP20 family protein
MARGSLSGIATQVVEPLGDCMATTDFTKETGLIRGLRDRWRRSKHSQRRQGDRTMADIVKRSDYPITEWDPFRMMREMLRWDPFRTSALVPQFERDMWMPHFEVRENDNSIRVIADLPGVKRDEIDISLTGNRLVVSGQREAEQRHKDENVHTWERQFGQFTRTFTLPDNVDLDHVTSELRDGVLMIVAPLKAGARSRKIQIGGTQPKS